MDGGIKLQAGSPGSELLKQSNRLSDLVSDHSLPTNSILSAFTKEVHCLQPLASAKVETDKLSLKSVDSHTGVVGEHGKEMDIQFAPATETESGGQVVVSDKNSGSGTRVVSDVESHYNYNQYTTHFVHSLQTPKMASTLEDFEVVSTIGTGSYGTCKKIRRKRDGKIMVWKEMDYGSMSEAEKQLLVSEVNLLRELKHRHIVRYYDRIIDRTRSVIYILMEYCQGGDLSTLITRCRKDGTHVDEDFAWRILIQTTLALKECHRRKNGKAILHRDLKPANIFLDRHQNVKLGDFGLARVLHHETSFAQTYVGTPYYMSPELVNNMSYNDKSDVWALGCLLYEMCALHPPFIASNQTELNRKIRIGDFPRIPAKYSSELDRIVRRMIKVEVSQRPSIDDILRDPVVAQRYQQIEPSSDQYVHSSDSGEAVSRSDEANVNNSNNRHGQEEGAGRIRQLEDEYKRKLRQLELKEKELESRERSLGMKEKLAEDKLRRAMELLEHYRRRSGSVSSERRFSDLISAHDPPLSPDIDAMDSPHSCLTKTPKDPESPKKRVTFDFYGKENMRQKSKLGDYGADGLTTAYNIYSQQLAKRPDLKDRLLYQKDKPLDLHRIGMDTKYNPRNLLFFR